jgi:glycosyltransferase involved in cell wall biosynthesis
MLLGEPPAGLLVEPGNARELANGILKILQDQAFSRLLIERGLVRVQEYDWKKLAAMMDKVYQGRFQV